MYFNRAVNKLCKQTAWWYAVSKQFHSLIEVEKTIATASNLQNLKM